MYGAFFARFGSCWKTPLYGKVTLQQSRELHYETR